MEKITLDEKLKRLYQMVEDYVILQIGNTHPFKDDIIQDTVMKIYNSSVHMRSHINDYGFNNYLYKLVDSSIENYNISEDDIENVVYTEYNTINSVIMDDLKNDLTIIQTLTNIEQAVLYYRFYEELTLKEIGNIYGVSSERIRVIEAKALRKMRHPTRSKRLRGYLQYFDDMPYELK